MQSCIVLFTVNRRANVIAFMYIPVYKTRNVIERVACFMPIDTVITRHFIHNDRGISMSIQHHVLMPGRCNFVSRIICCPHTHREIIVSFMQPPFLHFNVIAQVIADGDHFSLNSVTINQQRDNIAILCITINHAADRNMTRFCRIDDVIGRDGIHADGSISMRIQYDSLSCGRGCRITSSILTANGNRNAIFTFVEDITINGDVIGQWTMMLVSMFNDNASISMTINGERYRITNMNITLHTPRNCRLPWHQFSEINFAIARNRINVNTVFRMLVNNQFIGFAQGYRISNSINSCDRIGNFRVLKQFRGINPYFKG